jgi:hypothetical protein
MARFNGPGDFIGSYSGSYDGRRATLRIEQAGPGRSYRLTFTEVERNQVFVGTHQESGAQQHILTNITLTGGGGTVTWHELLLHTWDITYLSGTSVWNGIDFPMFWRRQG